MADEYATPIHEKRIAAGLTQVETAAAAGLAPRHYQQIEKYQVMPGVVTGIRIAIVLRSTVETLWRDALE